MSGRNMAGVLERHTVQATDFDRAAAKLEAEGRTQLAASFRRSASGHRAAASRIARAYLAQPSP